MRVGAGRWRGRLPVIEGVEWSGWPPGYQGDQQRRTALATPLMSCHRAVLCSKNSQSLAGVGAGVQEFTDEAL